MEVIRISRKKAISAIGLSSIFIVLSMMQLSLAYAAEPQDVSFEVQELNFYDFEPLKVKNKMSVTRFYATGLMTGDISGTFHWTETTTSHYESPPPPYDLKLAKDEIEIVIVATVGTKSGELVIKVKRIGIVASGHVEQTWRIVSGTGDLAKLRGTGEFTWTSPDEIEFEGTIR